MQQLPLAAESTIFLFQIFVVRYNGKNKPENSSCGTCSFTAALQLLTLLICHLSLVLVTQICKKPRTYIYACGPGHKIRQHLLTDLLAGKKFGLLRQPSFFG